MENKDLMELNYRLADVLVYIKAFEDGVNSNPYGNDKQKNALLNLCNWLNSNLKDSKTIVSRSIEYEKESN